MSRQSLSPTLLHRAVQPPHAVAAMVMVVVSCLLEGVTTQAHYYTVSRGGSTLRGRVADSKVLDTLQRGHEGLMMQLDKLNTAIKEDELKLNNVFYKLGRHDTDIQSTTSVQASLRDTTRKLEAKLNKQSYNVDYLRRHVSELKRGIVNSASSTAAVDSLKTTVAELQQSLAKALYRTELLENKTSRIQKGYLHSPNTHYSPEGIDENNIYYSSRMPKTTYYYLNPDSIKGVCPESSGWISVLDGGCWWLSGERLSFTEAVVSCTKQGGVLGQLPQSEDAWPAHLKTTLRDNPSTRYWTSGTDAFTPGEWKFLFSGDAISSEHWSHNHGINNNSSRGVPSTLGSDCAAITAMGLVPEHCSLKYLYLCEKLLI